MEPQRSLAPRLWRRGRTRALRPVARARARCNRGAHPGARRVDVGARRLASATPLGSRTRPRPGDERRPTARRSWHRWCGYRRLRARRALSRIISPSSTIHISPSMRTVIADTTPATVVTDHSGAQPRWGIQLRRPINLAVVDRIATPFKFLLSKPCVQRHRASKPDRIASTDKSPSGLESRGFPASAQNDAATSARSTLDPLQIRRFGRVRGARSRTGSRIKRLRRVDRCRVSLRQRERRELLRANRAAPPLPRGDGRAIRVEAGGHSASLGPSFSRNSACRHVLTRMITRMITNASATNGTRGRDGPVPAL